MLDFEYGVNTGNRFLQFVDHDEEPDAFIAAQTKPDVPQKKTATKDSKTTTSTKKVTSQKTTTATSSTSASSTTKTNKENLTSKSTSVDQRRQPSATTSTVFSDNNQQTRLDSARGTRGGGVRRGGGGGAPFDGASRGRSQRFNKFEGQQGASSFDQTGEGWSNEGGARGSRGGGARRGNSDAPRGSATGRGGRGSRGGRGNFNNRSFEEGQQADTNSWQTDTYDANRGAGNDVDISPQERPFESDNTRRNNRGSYRGRGQTNRNFTDRGEGTEGSQEDYRANRRLHDRQPRNFVSTVKPIEKKDGEGAHNWGNPTENPEDHPISEEITETTGPGGAAVSKDWAQQVDEAEKQMTFDEYKKQVEAKKRAHQEKLPQFKTRTAGEGEDPKSWQKPAEVYRKKNQDGSDEDEDDEGEEGSGIEENEEEEDEEEQISGKKKLISIPLHFKPLEMPRGSSRGGPRRGSGNPRFRERSNRDEPSASTSTNQDPSSQPVEDSQPSYRGAASAPRGGRGEYRRSYGNSARGSRQGRSQNDPNAPALDNPDDFPTLPKQ